MMKRNTYLGLCLLIAFASCKKNDQPDPGDTGKELILSATQLQQSHYDNAFTFKLFKSIATDDNDPKNIFVSPLSVSFAMGMTSNGSNGETLSAIRSTMNFQLPEDQVNNYYNKLITDLPQLDSKTNIKIANSVWYKQGFSVLPQFAQTLTSSYNAKVQSLNFSDPSSKNTINSWVNEQTNGKIPSIIDQIQDGTIMYLINAIYFKSAWNHPFDAANTVQQPFYLANNGQVTASFMSDVFKAKTYTDNSVSILELPYANNKYSMVIAMPANGGSLSSLVTGLDSVKWQSWISKLATAEVNLHFPKFKFGYNISLKNTLITLGMGNAFSDKADFSRISTAGGLQLTDVMHKAIVEVNEEGTVAAAATSVSVGTTAARQDYITINHPFVFAIREIKTGLILFMGKVNNPLLPGS